jgi:hypothetical protein
MDDLASTLKATSLESSATANIKLCSVCEGLSFPADGRPTNRGNLPLGKLQDIRRKDWCPFCRLILSALLDGPEPCNFKGDQELTLMTRENGYLLYGQNLGTEIWFFSDEKSEVRRAESLRLVPKREISNLLASNWLKMCQTHHGQQCRPVSLLTQPEVRQKLLPSLRAIDVVLNCVVEMPLHSRYLTLSYVWGDVACVRLAKGNAKSLMIENSLVNFRNISRER